MKQINNLLVVEVPEIAFYFDWIECKEGKCIYWETEDNRIGKKLIGDVKLGDVMTKLSEISEKDCKRFVKFKPHRHNDYDLYFNYSKINAYTLGSAKGSLISLLQANDIDTSNEEKILIIEVL